MTMVPLKIMRPGFFAHSRGNRAYFDRAELQRISDVYNNRIRSRRPAPLCIGYHEGAVPMLGGTVSFLEERNEFLLAYVECARGSSFAERIERGEFLRHAAQFFEPYDPNNPVPSAWTLKSIGFMGKPHLEFGESLTGYMHSLKDSGRPVDNLWRSNGFVEFSSRPSHATDIALIARAYMDAELRCGRQCNIAQAVGVIRATLGTD